MTHGGANEKTWSATGRAGCLSLKRATETGALTGTFLTKASDSPNRGAKYHVRCISHGCRANAVARNEKGAIVSTRSIAIKMRRVPSIWCSGCKRAIEARITEE